MVWSLPFGSCCSICTTAASCTTNYKNDARIHLQKGRITIMKVEAESHFILTPGADTYDLSKLSFLVLVIYCHYVDH
jgi:hypothetical protein